MATAIRKWASIWFDAAKTAFVTHALAVMALAVFIASEALGIRHQSIETLGVQSENWYTLFTHAIMHISWGHIVWNLVLLEWAGPFVERWPETHFPKWTAKLIYISAILAITASGAQSAVTLASEHWTNRGNPVGMSISIYALMATGLYIWVRNRISSNSHRISQLARNAKREMGSWVAVAVVAAMMAFILWIGSSTTVGPGRIGHTAGAVMGLCIAAAYAAVRTLRDEEPRKTGEDDQEENEQHEDNSFEDSAS